MLGNIAKNLSQAISDNPHSPGNLGAERPAECTTARLYAQNADNGGNLPADYIGKKTQRNGVSGRGKITECFRAKNAYGARLSAKIHGVDNQHELRATGKYPADIVFGCHTGINHGGCRQVFQVSAHSRSCTIVSFKAIANANDNRASALQGLKLGQQIFVERHSRSHPNVQLEFTLRAEDSHKITGVGHRGGVLIYRRGCLLGL